MKKKRVLSMETKIYHRPACRYVKRIQMKNRMELSPGEAQGYGYRPCRCCNTMSYLYETEWSNINYLTRKRNMEIRMIDGILFVKTAVGCWKLIYSRKEEKIVLYHCNNSAEQIDFGNIRNEPCHRQTDCPHSGTICGLLNYIFEHDRFREAQKKGVQLTTFTSERSRRLAVRTQRREQRKRLDNLFSMLERDNKGLRELSYC